MIRARIAIYVASRCIPYMKEGSFTSNYFPSFISHSTTIDDPAIQLIAHLPATLRQLLSKRRSLLKITTIKVLHSFLLLQIFPRKSFACSWSSRTRSRLISSSRNGNAKISTEMWGNDALERGSISISIFIQVDTKLIGLRYCKKRWTCWRARNWGILHGTSSVPLLDRSIQSNRRD